MKGEKMNLEQVTSHFCYEELLDLMSSVPGSQSDAECLFSQLPPEEEKELDEEIETKDK